MVNIYDLLAKHPASAIKNDKPHVLAHELNLIGRQMTRELQSITQFEDHRLYGRACYICIQLGDNIKIFRIKIAFDLPYQL